MLGKNLMNQALLTDGGRGGGNKKNIQLPVIDENYIYISHLDEDLQYWYLPCVPDEWTDSMGSTFAENSALGRSAPVYTYSQSGPRTVDITLNFHRDMMNDINRNRSNAKQGWGVIGEDYVDNLIHALQAIAVPKYNLSNKAIEPPLVAVRFANELFIKGVVTNQIAVTYKKPIFANGKFAQVSLGLTISEVDPYDASSIYTNGSFRGMVTTMKRVNEIDHRMGDW